jgi:hypothetical protein
MKVLLKNYSRKVMAFKGMALTQSKTGLEQNAVFIFSQTLERRLRQVFVMKLEFLGNELVPCEKVLYK